MSTYVRGGWARFVSSRTRVCRLLWEDRRVLHHGAASGALGLHCQRLIIQHTQASNLPCLILSTADTTCAPSQPSQRFHCLFTLGSVHYSGYDNYVTKIWCICCLTTCLGVGCFVFSYLGKSFGKTISQKKTKQGKTFGVCQLLRADSKCETEKQEYFNHFCSCIGLKRNIH